MGSLRSRSGIMAAVAFVSLSACGGRHESTEVYTLVTVNTKIAYWQDAVAGLNAAGRDLGVKVDVAGPEGYDPKAEKEEFLRITAAKIKPAGILVSAADPEVMRGAIDSAVTSGIPVVAIDSDSPKSKRLLFIGTNNYEVGQIGGAILAKELKGKGQVTVYSIPGQSNLDERLEGYKRVLAREPGIKIAAIIDIKGEGSTAFDTTRNMLKESSTIPDAFVCLEALSCPEVADVLDRSNIRGKTIIAMDAGQSTLEWIRKGMIRATIAQKPYTMAYYGLRVLDDLHHNRTGVAVNPAQEGHASLPMFIDTGTTVVDQSNVASFLTATTPTHR